jgi:Tfp pilus assembly protein FimV
MVSKKNAVSVHDTRSKQMARTVCISAPSTDEITQVISTRFKRNMFLSAFLLSNIFFAEQSFALSVQPIQVKSALGEPFRAQLVITDITGVNPATIKAALASDSEFIQLGINKRRLANDLNFNTVITSPERGIINISSDRPLNDPYIEFVVHIGFGNSVRLQQVTALVDPPLTRIQPETLNLPVQQIQLAQASQTPTPPSIQPSDPNIVKVTSSVTTRTIPLLPSRNAPPPMSAPIAETAETPLAKSVSTQDTPLVPSKALPPPMTAPAAETLATPPVNNVAAQDIPLTPSPSTPPPMAAPAPEAAPKPIEQNATVVPSIPAPEQPPVEETSTKNSSYKVKRNESLWSIANRLQKGTNRPVTVIMHSIQQMNQAAFIHGNPNQIKNGATIILPNQQDDAEETPKIDTPSTQVNNDNVESNKTPILRTPTQQAKAAKIPYVRRGHLPDAKMTLVAPAQEGSAQGSVTEKQSEEKTNQLKQLNLNITAARQKNMTLSQEISELEAKIKANDQKLALRNARLAELMQRLKNRKDAAPQNAKRTPTP